MKICCFGDSEKEGTLTYRKTLTSGELSVKRKDWKCSESLKRDPALYGYEDGRH